jgi:hypothetical protein
MMVIGAAFNMLQPWVGLVSLVGVLVVAGIVIARRRISRRSDPDDDAPIANVFHAEASTSRSSGSRSRRCRSSASQRSA